MNRYKVLLPEVLVEPWEPTFWKVQTDKGVFKIIDEVSYVWNADDCRQTLIDYDGYNPYIVCVQV